MNYLRVGGIYASGVEIRSDSPFHLNGEMVRGGKRFEPKTETLSITAGDSPVVMGEPCTVGNAALVAQAHEVVTVELSWIYGESRSGRPYPQQAGIVVYPAK